MLIICGVLFSLFLLYCTDFILIGFNDGEFTVMINLAPRVTVQTYDLQLPGHIDKVTIEISSAGCEDFQPEREEVHCGKGNIKVNGKELSVLKRGHNMVIIDYVTGTFIDRHNFDTYEDNCADCMMSTAIHNAPDDSIIMVSVMDEGSAYVNKSKPALRMVGAQNPLAPTFRGSWALVGYKGKRQVDWVEQQVKDRGEGIAEIKKTIKLGEPIQSANAISENENLLGKLHHHFWHDMCGHVTDVLRRNTLAFPYKPKCRCLISTLETEEEWMLNTAQRIYGYIHPPMTGEYKFAISGDDCADVWLSNDEDPKKAQLLASIGQPGLAVVRNTEMNDFSQLASQISKPVYLEQGKKYFIDVLQKQEAGMSFVQVRWRPPSGNFEKISPEYLSLYSHEGDIYSIPKDVPSYLYDPIIEFDTRLYLHTLPILPRDVTDDVLPTCEYTPSYIFARKLRKYEGYDYVKDHEAKIYPDDFTKVHFGSDIDPGNQLIEHEIVQRVVGRYMKSFQLRHSKYTLKQIANVELQVDPEKGNRFLIELELIDKSKGQTVRLSRYIFEKKYTLELCYPKDFEWDPKAPVNIVIAVKNQADWLKMFLQDMHKTVTELQDDNVKVIVVDYRSTDANVKEILEKSKVNYSLIEKDGKWSKTLAIAAGANSVTDPNSIIFTTDLHIDYPVTLIDNIRKHTIKGKMVYTPMILRLNCGYTLEQPNGFWEIVGFGLVGTYKQDWSQFGGINTAEYGTKWGGEDWDIMDRILENGMEAHRLRLQHMFHHFHTHDGMWEQSNANWTATTTKTGQRNIQMDGKVAQFVEKVLIAWGKKKIGLS